MKNLRIGNIDKNEKYSLAKEVKSGALWGLSYGAIVGAIQSATMGITTNNMPLGMIVYNVVIDALVGAGACGSYAYAKNYIQNIKKEDNNKIR